MKPKNRNVDSTVLGSRDFRLAIVTDVDQGTSIFKYVDDCGGLYVVRIVHQKPRYAFVNLKQIYTKLLFPPEMLNKEVVLLPVLAVGEHAESLS